MVQVVERNAIPKEQTWNAESMFADTAAWQAEFEAVSAELPQLKDFDGAISQDPAKLATYLQTVSMLGRRFSTLGFYASMRNSVDNDTEAKALLGQFSGTVAQFSALTAFAEPEMLAMGEDKLLGWIDDHDDLKMYDKMVRDLFRAQAHVRSAEVEEVLGMLGDAFGTASRTAGELTNTDLKFPDAVGSDGGTFAVTQSTMDSAKGHADREIRRTAWQNYADSYKAFDNTLANAYVASVKQSTMQMRVRGYESVLEMQLFPHHLPVEVFHNLIDTFKKNLPTWHRYWDVRRRALGLDTIHPYDIWAPLTPNEPEVSFEQAVDYISEGMKPLGDDYVEIMRRGCLEERWVDRAVNHGKRQGAFSGGSYDSYPFIMMSYDDTLGAMSTLAHELGHSLHSYHSRKNQPVEYARYSMFAAETASNFNQAMTRAYLFEQDLDRDFELSLIQEAMDNFHRYFFIMPTLARFEYEVHNRVAAGQPLTAAILNNLMSDLYAEGYGETMTDDRERTGITWAQFGHLYIPFYTFQYATGISAAHALSDKVLNENGAQPYLEFLAAGKSVNPLEILKHAGVDMTTPAAVEKAFAVLAALVDRLENLIES